MMVKSQKIKQNLTITWLLAIAKRVLIYIQVFQLFHFTFLEKKKVNYFQWKYFEKKNNKNDQFLRTGMLTRIFTG